MDNELEKEKTAKVAVRTNRGRMATTRYFQVRPEAMEALVAYCNELGRGALATHIGLAIENFVEGLGLLKDEETQE